MEAEIKMPVQDAHCCKSVFYVSFEHSRIQDGNFDDYRALDVYVYALDETDAVERTTARIGKKYKFPEGFPAVREVEALPNFLSIREVK